MKKWVIGGITAAVCVFLLLSLFFVYTWFRIDVPSKHIAVLTNNVGKDLANDMEVSPDSSYKGIQKEILPEGRHFRNPYFYDWKIEPMVEIPAGRLGVIIRMVGEDLPYGEIIAWKEGQKGIVPTVLNPGRYAINPHIDTIELHEPVTIPAGFKGVVTLLAAPMSKNPNRILVDAGQRGVQDETLSPGTYYFNPYTTRVNLVDCRSQRFNIVDGGDMGFPSKDGFWVALDGIIEFRVKPDMAAEVFVQYNDDQDGENIDEEIIKKIILPNTRSFCRLKGSSNQGRDFIGGDTRIQFQKDFQQAMQDACEPVGVEIIQALITRIKPPEAIAQPIREREVFVQQLDQYKHQIQQQESEKKLAVQKSLIERNQKLVEAQKERAKMVLSAQKEQQVAITKAEENLEVAKYKLSAAKDEAEAITSRGEAKADVIKFENAAAAAGWKEAVDAFGGDGDVYAKYVLYNKLAPGYKSIMSNTENSALMKIFNDTKVPLRNN